MYLGSSDFWHSSGVLLCTNLYNNTKNHLNHENYKTYCTTRRDFLL